MKAILRTYENESNFSDTIVNVDDNHTFESSYVTTVNFSVGSNQTIIPLDSLSHKELLSAVKNTTIKNF